MRTRLVLPVLLGLALSGCGFGAGSLLPSLGSGAGGQTVQALWREGIVLTVEGRLQGAPSRPGHCRLLYPENGEPYAVIGRSDDFPEGMRVRVTGPVALWSACETYRTLRADRVEPAV